MKIQHNHSAAIAYTYQTEQQRQMSKTVQKLASGFRINRAGDDAAGLAISEKMRGQIRGLHMAQKNASDGMSMLQVAEGALQETHAMLQRLRELSVQAANDTNTDEDRAMLQQEVTSLLEQIDKNAHDTQFNTQPLLNGHHLTGEKGYTLQVGANSGQHMNMKVAGEATLKGLGLGVETKTVEIPGEQVHHEIGLNITIEHMKPFKFFDFVIKMTDNPEEIGFKQPYTSLPPNTLESGKLLDDEGKALLYYGEEISINKDSYDNLKVLQDQLAGKTETQQKALVKLYQKDWDHINEELAKFSQPYVELTLSRRSGFIYIDETIKVNETFVYDEANGAYVSRAAYIESPKITTEMSIEEQNEAIEKLKSAYGVTDSNMRKQISLSDPTASRVPVQLPSTTEEVDIPAVSVLTQQQANDAIGTFDKAIAVVSSMRVQIGAYMNRLEHTIENVSTSAENVTAAESRIRDTDMAKEMMHFTKRQILMQSSTAMLGQANQHPAMILQLLA